MLKLNPASLARKMSLVLSLIDVSKKRYENIDLMFPCLKNIVFSQLLVNPFLNREEKIEIFVLLQKSVLSFACRMQLACMKPESLVMAGQLYNSQFVPGSCTHSPSHYGEMAILKIVTLIARSRMLKSGTRMKL